MRATFVHELWIAADAGKSVSAEICDVGVWNHWGLGLKSGALGGVRMMGS